MIQMKGGGLSGAGPRKAHKARAMGPMTEENDGIQCLSTWSDASLASPVLAAPARAPNWDERSSGAGGAG